MNDLDWSALRSACHRKAWREAWEIVGTDHTGNATPGEVYIFGLARQARAVAAALASWCYVSGDTGTILFKGASWARIKQIAAWESQAAAQHDPHVMARRAAAVMRLAMASGARITVGGREITGYQSAHLIATAWEV